MDEARKLLGLGSSLFHHLRATPTGVTSDPRASAGAVSPSRTISAISAPRNARLYRTLALLRSRLRLALSRHIFAAWQRLIAERLRARRLLARHRAKQARAALTSALWGWRGVVQDAGTAAAEARYARGLKVKQVPIVDLTDLMRQAIAEDALHAEATLSRVKQKVAEEALATEQELRINAKFGAMAVEARAAGADTHWAELLGKARGGRGVWRRRGLRHGGCGAIPVCL